MITCSGGGGRGGGGPAGWQGRGGAAAPAGCCGCPSYLWRAAGADDGTAGAGGKRFVRVQVPMFARPMHSWQAVDGCPAGACCDSELWGSCFWQHGRPASREGTHRAAAHLVALGARRQQRLPDALLGAVGHHHFIGAVRQPVLLRQLGADGLPQGRGAGVGRVARVPQAQRLDARLHDGRGRVKLQGQRGGAGRVGAWRRPGWQQGGRKTRRRQQWRRLAALPRQQHHAATSTRQQQRA